MTERNLGDTVRMWFGIVTDINDPQQSGRVQVRVHGKHDDTVNIPNADLPWAQVLQPVTSAARGRIGTAPVGLVERSRIVGLWLDSDQQYPLVLGSIGRAGEIIAGQTNGGAPAVNINVGSIPGAAQNNVNNPYSSLNPSRVTIQDIDSGQENIDGVPLGTGVAVTQAVEEGMQNANTPTTGSAEPSETNVLQILRRVDPTSSLSSLPCLPFNALQLQIQIDLGSIAAGLINVITDAVTNALLSIMESLGTNSVLDAIKQAANGIANFRDALDALTSRGLCGAPKALSSINTGTQALARSYSSLQNAALRFGNSTSEIRRTLGFTQTNIISNVPTALFRPINISLAPPNNYVQGYYAANADPYPGYIRWYDPNDPSAQSVFTLRNGQPNFISAQQHVQFDVEQAARTALQTAITGGNLTSSTLNTIMNQVVGIGQIQGYVRSMGNGFNPATIAGMASLALRVAPLIIGTVRGVFEGNISVSVLTNTGQIRNAVTNFTRLQTKLAMRRTRLETALRRI